MTEVSPAAAMLRAMRTARGRSQEELASRSGLSDRTIRAIETGRIRLPQRETLHRIAGALELEADATAEFVGAWAHQAAGPRSLESMVTLVSRRNEWAQRLSTQAERIEELQLAGTATLPRSRCTGTIRWRRSFRARTPGITGYLFMIQGNGDETGRAPITVPFTRNCRLARTVDVPGDLIVFQFAFDHELAVGETISFEYEIDRGGDHPCALVSPDDLEELIAVRALGPSLFMQVQFSPDDLPSRIWQVHHDNLSTEVSSEPLAVSAFGVAAIVIERPAPGFHGLRWAW